MVRPGKFYNYFLKLYSLPSTNTWSNCIITDYGFRIVSICLKGCYGRPLLQARLLPDLNTISDDCVTEN